MKTQNKVERLFLVWLLLFILTLASGMLFFLQREKAIQESMHINKVRTYTSSIRNLINEAYPNIDEASLEEHLEELQVKVLISDVNSNVLYNNTSFTTSNIAHDLYQDNTYSLTNTDKLKISFPITSGASVLGFMVFELPKAALYEANNTYAIMLVLVALMLGVVSFYLIHTYKKTVKDPLHHLEVALLDVSKGLYKELDASEGPSIESVTNYNIMLAQIENNLSTQADYAKARKQLIADISHEIRTPLSYVKLSAEILSKDKNCTSENKKYIETILQKIKTIDGIIEDLFSYSRQDLDKLSVQPKEVYAKEMFDRIFSSIEVKDKTKDIKIRWTNAIENVLIQADESRLTQVIYNMVDNAEKHIKQRGQITLTSELDENHIVLIIEDTGEGILPKDLPYIFEPFYQGEQDEATKNKGAGLGLAICDYIVKKHDGEIFVYSEVDKGTKFVLKLPEII